MFLKNDEKLNTHLRYLLLVAMYFFAHDLISFPPMPCNGVHGFYLLPNNCYNHDFTCKIMEFQLIKTVTLISAAEAFLCVYKLTRPHLAKRQIMKYVYNVRFDFNAIILNHKIIKIVNKEQQLLYIARGYLITSEKRIYKLCCAENLVFLFSHFLREQLCLCKRKLFICIIARKNHY